MTRRLGYIFATIGLAGFVFSISHIGTQVPLKELWFVVSIFLGIYGAFLIVKHRYQSQNNNQGVTLETLRIDRIKQTGDKIKVTLNNCKVKSRTYQEDNINTDFPTGIEMRDGLYSSNRNYKTKEIQQTYVVYYKKYDNSTYKFVSQTVDMGAEALKSYIDEQGAFFYVDRTNPKNYHFDLSGG